MNKCKKNVLLIFGYLLMIAFLIVPYREIGTTAVSVGRNGWVFWPIALISKTYFVINPDVLTTEIAVILFAAGFAYILFCIVLKKGG